MGEAEGMGEGEGSGVEDGGGTGTGVSAICQVKNSISSLQHPTVRFQGKGYLLGDINCTPLLLLEYTRKPSSSLKLIKLVIRLRSPRVKPFCSSKGSISHGS